MRIKLKHAFSRQNIYHMERLNNLHNASVFDLWYPNERENETMQANGKARKRVKGIKD